MTKLQKLLLATLTLCYAQSVKINLFALSGPIKTFETDLSNLTTFADLKTHIMTELNQLPEYNDYNAPGEVIKLQEGQGGLSLPLNNEQVLNITVVKTKKPFFELQNIWARITMGL